MKLKTLADIEKNKLREEAKEWIEELKDNGQILKWCNFCREKFEEKEIEYWDCGCTEAIINWIKHFFNLK